MLFKIELLYCRYFCKNQNATVLNNQVGIFRTNCIDCLDRTNVVQSLLAKRILQVQLIKLSIIGETDSIESNHKLHQVFRDMWADNGDFLSKQYAGTGALKSDFTRTGKRTLFGMARDGVNSLTRYYLNNFQDGFRQVNNIFIYSNCFLFVYYNFLKHV